MNKLKIAMTSLAFVAAIGGVLATKSTSKDAPFSPVYVSIGGVCSVAFNCSSNYVDNADQGLGFATLNGNNLYTNSNCTTQAYIK